MLLREEVVRPHFHRSRTRVFAGRADQTAVDPRHSFGAEDLVDRVGRRPEAFRAIGVVDHRGLDPLAWSRDHDTLDNTSGDPSGCVVEIAGLPIVVFESVDGTVEDEVAEADFQC